MSKRSEYTILVSFAVLAVGLGFWGYALAGSAFSPSSPDVYPWPAGDYTSKTVHSLFTLTWMGAAHCLMSSIGLIRFYDLFQPWKDPWQLVVAQFAVPGVALLSAGQLFLVGLRKNIRTAMARHKADHVVVCGVGDVGMQVIQNLRGAGHQIVAVDLLADSPSTATCEKSGVPVLQGDAKNPQVLLAAGIRRAQTVIMSTGSDTENMDIALQIKSLYAEQPTFKQSGIQALALVRNDWMHKRLIGSDAGSLGSDHVDLRLFNPFTNAARMLINHLYLPPAPEFEARTFVVIGFGAYGREIAQHLIRACPVGLGAMLKILVFDQNAAQVGEQFPIAYPVAAQVAAFKFVTASVAPGSPDIHRIVEEKLEAAEPLLGVAVALGDDETSLCAALEVRSLLDCTGHLHVPVYVRLEHYRRLGELVREIESVARFGDRLQVFGTLEETLNPEVLLGSRLDAFAQELHEDYRRRSQAQINPQANVPWYELPEFMKMSNRWRADHTPLLLQLAGIRVAASVQSPAVTILSTQQIETLAQLEHRRYTIERQLIEWRRAAQRVSTHLEPWELLPEEYKEWNRREVARLPEIMAGLGMELRPVHTLRLYGGGLPAAAQELEKMLASPRFGDVCVIADLDDAEAVRLGTRALALPSLSLWLLSNAEPPEFFTRKVRSDAAWRNALVQRANGWARRERVVLGA